MLAAVLHHDGQQLTATQTRNQALSDADHLAVLHAIWTAETTPPATVFTRTSSKPPCRPATTSNPATR